MKLSQLTGSETLPKPPSMEDLEGKSQPEEFTEQQDIVWGVVEGDGSKDLTGC